MKTTDTPITPRIYVACLAAYNSGILHGAWIDADQDPDDLMDGVQAMLANSPVPDAEEWAIHDYEGFGRAHLSESEDFETVSGLAALIQEHGRIGRALLEHYAGDLGQAKQGVENYLGTYASLAAYAEQMMEGISIPEAVASYVDYERMGADIEINGDIFTIELGFDEVLVFSNR